MKLAFPNFTLEVGPIRQRKSAVVHPGLTEYCVHTNRAPDPEDIRAQIETQGFQLISAQIARSSGMAGLVAARGEEVLCVNLSGAPWNVVFAQLSVPSATARVEITDGAFAWDGVSWPAPFREAAIASLRDDSVCLDVIDDEPERVLDAIRAWAIAAGCTIEDPCNAWEPEPDLHIERGMRFLRRSDGITHRGRLAIEGENLLSWFLEQIAG